jgi:hypothetical protein
LRGLRPLKDSNGTNPDFYKDRTFKDYENQLKRILNQQGKETPLVNIFTGISLYDDVKRKLLKLPEDRELIAEYQRFLQDKFFQGKEVTLIPDIDSDTLSIKIGNDYQFPIYNLGDGLQTLIILTYKIITESEGLLFFIEEPDMFMHPSFQRILLEVMLENPQHQYFLTTHSNHMLDMAMDYSDISVFLFKKYEIEVPDNEHLDENGRPKIKHESRFTIEQKHVGDFEILHELGARNSSVFLTNATIWVEGITDRMYLREYLRKYMSDNNYPYKEDSHFSFVEYGGKNLVHWKFSPKADKKNEEFIDALKTVGSPFLITDGDVSQKWKDRFSIELPSRYWFCPGKEIENLIPEEILIKYLENELKDKFADNLKVKVNFKKYSTYKKNKKLIGLGGYLDECLNTTFASKNNTGTIDDKKKFCEDIIKLMREPNKIKWNLPEELENLCALIVNHIALANGDPIRSKNSPSSPPSRTISSKV